MKSLINNINYYKTRSANRLRDEQSAYIPTLEEDQIECTVNSYIMAGKRYLMNQYETICIRLKYLKLKSNTYRMREKYNNKNTSMRELVANNIIQPFALFVNGRFIPWDIISISICPNASYLLIDISGLDGKPIEFKDLISIKYAQILTLPDYVRYSNNGESLDYDVLCSFDSEGKFSTENPWYSLIIDKDPHVCTAYMNTSSRFSAIDISESLTNIYGDQIQLDKIKFCKENALLFVNGLFSLGVKENIKKGTDWDFVNEDYTDFAPKIQLVQSDEDLGTNPNIVFDYTNLTINNGHNDNGDVYDIVICANTEYSNTVDNIAKAKNDFIQPIVQKKYNGEEVPAYFEQLNTPFEMVMDRNTDYNTNVVNAIKSMLKYNSNSFAETFKRTSNLEITEKTGKWVNENTKIDNTLWIPRRHSEMAEEFIIMLVNGELYKYDHAINHRANFCIIPITGINDTDKIEFLRFKNINNYTFDIIVNNYDGENKDCFANHASDIINEDMVLFSDEPLESDPYEYPSDGKQYFPVNYTLERSANGLIKIVLENDFYYGKTLKVAYKNRYVHAQYVVPGEEYVQYAIDLKEKFAFCNDYTKFLVFHNGRKLDSNFYRIVLPSRSTTPFYEFKLYFSIPVNELDNIDVIYTPSLMKDIVYQPEAELSGSIIVDKSILNYGIGSELFIVWINGRKIPASNIQDISSTQMHILTDELSTRNLTITKYIPDIDTLIGDFHAENSDWDNIISQLTPQEIYNMLGINSTGLTDQEPDINEGAVDIKSVMYELIREQYVMNPRVDITDKFVYDYLDVDQTAAEETDTDGNVLFSVADANRQDNIDGTPWSESVLKEE